MPRILQETFELQSIAASGWTEITSGHSLVAPILDINGNGGAVALARASGAATSGIVSPEMTAAVVEATIKCHYIWNGGSLMTLIGWHSNAGVSEINARVDSAGHIALYRGGAFLSTSSFILTSGSTYLFELTGRLLQSGGLIEAFIDGVSILSFSGDTVNNGSSTTLNKVYLAPESNAKTDDIVCNAPAVQYDGGSGTAPIAGQVISGAGGASATIGTVVGDATSGHVYLYSWNGTSFVDNEVLTTATLTALVDAPTVDYVNGLMPHSLMPGNEFLMAFSPNAVGNSSQLGAFGGGTAASETLTTTGQPLNNETVTIDTKVYTFQTVLTDVDGNVLIGATQALSMENLRRAINLDGIAGTNYATSMTLHPTATATDTATTVVATARYTGTQGNSIATTETLTNGSWGAATMSGGLGENYERVDDNPPISTDYVESIDTVSAKRDTYGINASGLPTSAQVSEITTVAVVAEVLSTLTGVDNARMIIRDGGVDYDNGADIALPLSATAKSHIFQTHPDGSGAFTRDPILAFEAGIELKP